MASCIKSESIRSSFYFAYPPKITRRLSFYIRYFRPDQYPFQLLNLHIPAIPRHSTLFTPFHQIHYIFPASLQTIRLSQPFSPTGSPQIPFQRLSGSIPAIAYNTRYLEDFE